MVSGAEHQKVPVGASRTSPTHTLAFVVSCDLVVSEVCCDQDPHSDAGPNPPQAGRRAGRDRRIELFILF